MPNQVQVDFVGNAKPLYATADATPAKLAQSGDAAGKAYATAFEKQLAVAQSRVGASPQDQQIFRNLQIQSAQAAAEIDKTQRAAAFASSKAKLEIYRAEKAAEIGLETETANKVKQVRGFGALFRIAGLQQIGITEGEINAGINLYNKYIERGAEAAKSATATAQAAAASQSSIAALAESLGGLGIAGAFVTIAAGAAIVYHITKDIADAEAQHLKFIEDGVKARNKAIIAQKESLDLLQKARQEAELERKIKAETATSDIASLKSRRDLVEKLLQLNPSGANAADQRKEILALEARLAAIPGERTDAANKSFEQRNEDFKKAQRENAEFEQRQAEKRIEKAKELNKVTQDFFQSLRERSNSDNPFFKILNDAAALEKQIAKLNPEFQALARTQASLLTANSLFGAKIDNVLGVSDLRQQASFFRNGQSGLTPERDDQRIRRQLAVASQLSLNTKDQLGGLDTSITEIIGNVDVTKLPQNVRDALAGAIDRQAARRVEALTTTRVGGKPLTETEKANADLRDKIQSGQFSPEAVNELLSLSNLRQQSQFVRTGVSEQETPQQRLARQFRELDKLSPANEIQRLAIDRRIASEGGRIDPTTLDQTSRNRVADSINRTADALANSQGEATKALLENTAVMKQLTNAFNKQVGNGFEVVVNNKSDAEIGITPQPKNPSSSDVSDLYPTDNFGFAGGQ